MTEDLKRQQQGGRGDTRAAARNHRHATVDADMRTRFTREARAVAALNHPNIVTIHEVDEFGGRPYFAMEHVAGESLRDVIKKGKLGVDDAVQLTMGICEGLHEAHSAGIVHRDIKPGNIIVDKVGKPRIVDFGLATIKGADLGTKLQNAGIGVVNEEASLVDEFGFSSSAIATASATTITVVDGTHYVTSSFGVGDLAISSSAIPLVSVDGTIALDLNVLADTKDGGKTLAVLESGGRRWDADTSAGRRVLLPWASEGVNFTTLTADANVILQCAIEWAAGMERS